MSKWRTPTHERKHNYSQLMLMLSAVMLLAKQHKWKACRLEIFVPGLKFACVYTRITRTQTGTRVTRLGPASEKKSDRSEFIFRSVSCRLRNRNVWRPTRTHAGLSSSRSHANSPWEAVSPTTPTISDSLQSTTTPSQSNFNKVQLYIHLLEIYGLSACWRFGTHLLVVLGCIISNL